MQYHELLLKSRSRFEIYWKLGIATALILVPPLVFEKYTFFLYSTGNSDYGTFSVSRLWFDIFWFVASGVLAAFIVGRERKSFILPPLLASFLFIVAVNVQPFCAVKECYVSSPDGLAPFRDFLLLGSLGVTTSALLSIKWQREGTTATRMDTAFQLCVVTMVGFALSFFPITHLFAGVSVPFPFNYLQWFLAGAPGALAASMLILDRGSLSNKWAWILSGISGTLLGLIVSLDLPCGNCSGDPTTIISILLLAVLFTSPALYFGSKISPRKRRSLPLRRFYRRSPGVIAGVSIIVALISMLRLLLRHRLPSVGGKRV